VYLDALPDRYEPTAHRLLEELSANCGFPVMPARPVKPRDKPKVELGVQVVERWILARLRQQSFFSLAALNRAIAILMVDLNQGAFKTLPGVLHRLPRASETFCWNCWTTGWARAQPSSPASYRWRPGTPGWMSPRWPTPSWTAS